MRRVPQLARQDGFLPGHRKVPRAAGRRKVNPTLPRQNGAWLLGASAFASSFAFAFCFCFCNGNGLARQPELVGARYLPVWSRDTGLIYLTPHSTYGGIASSQCVPNDGRAASSLIQLRMVWVRACAPAPPYHTVILTGPTYPTHTKHRVHDPRQGVQGEDGVGRSVGACAPAPPYQG